MIINAVFSPDGQHAFSGAFDNTAVYWDVATGSIIRRFTDHSAAVFAVELTPDGRFGLGGSSDNTTTLWDMKTGEVIRRYAGLNADVFRAAFSPDGREVLVVPFSSDLALWRIDASLDELLAWTKSNRYVPELTCAQRALYKLEPLCAEDTMTPTGEVTAASQ
jgi:WD40 repeat protein